MLAFVLKTVALVYIFALNIFEIQNVGGGTSVLRVMATDRDIGPNAMLFYYITAGNQDLTFRMDRMTGEMVTRPAPPDRERQQEYILNVTVEDDGTPPLSVSHDTNGKKSSAILFFYVLWFSPKEQKY